jgi:hypothetical protein
MGRLALAGCGVWLVGLGLYFIFVRPALLPEDPRYIGASLAQIDAAVPGLQRWLNHVFNVMGGFMVAAGALTLRAALPDTRPRLLDAALVVAGLSGVGLMSVTNFALDSDFKWLLLVPALLWAAGLALGPAARAK